MNTSEHNKHKWTQVNTSEHKWNTSGTLVEHKWTQVEHKWTQMEHKWTQMEHKWTQVKTMNTSEQVIF